MVRVASMVGLGSKGMTWKKLGEVDSGGYGMQSKVLCIIVCGFEGGHDAGGEMGGGFVLERERGVDGWTFDGVKEEARGKWGIEGHFWGLIRVSIIE